MKILDRWRQPPAMLKRTSGDLGAPSETSVTGRRYSQFVAAFLRNGNEANTMIEFALVAPLLLTVATGIWQVGMNYSNLISLTQATSQAAQTLQRDRTLNNSNDPCADTYNAFLNAAPSLVSSKVSLSITINNGTPVTTNTCSGAQIVEGGPVSVKATYPYTVSIYGISAASGSMSPGTVTEVAY